MAVETLSVSELLSAVDAALRVCFPDEIWVEGEISALRSMPTGGGRHVFFNLVDPTTDGEPGSIRPVLPVKLFDSQRQRVNAHLKRYGSIKMTDGVRVRIKGRLQFYAARSQVELRMSLLDPTYTLALLATERDRVLRALVEEGLLERNASIPMTEVPLAVGLVTSTGSAAAADFLHELEQSTIAWHVIVAHSRVQGAGAEATLAAALRVLQARDVDVIAIVRGGGARTELATFDAEPLARAIATCRVPVVTGIGHEIDESVADRVAHLSYKTPTACAAALVARVGAFLGSLDTVRSDVLVAASDALQQERRRTDRSAGVVEGHTRVHVAHARSLLSVAQESLITNARRAVVSSTATLEHLDARIRSLDPARVLARGWTITRTEDGRAIRSAREAQHGDRLVTTFADGTATSVVDAVP
ncbi:MAG: exodeoxyribonuclease VII large subunit [Actinobacteria bacterium]|nr:exodeoxyribonuclease VII large subunit [Actinomycetota bacterium]